METKDESRAELFTAINTFFAETMKIEPKIEINDVYRMGNGRDRSIMIKLCFPSDKAVIFEHASNLKGIQNARKKLYFIKKGSVR